MDRRSAPADPRQAVGPGAGRYPRDDSSFARSEDGHLVVAVDGDVRAAPGRRHEDAFGGGAEREALDRLVVRRAENHQLAGVEIAEITRRGRRA